MRISIVGLGLIGGSMALDLRSSGFATRILGVEIDKHHSKEAKRLKLVDEVVPIEAAVRQSDLIIVAIPVQQSIKLISLVLDQVKSQVIIDVGSTKHEISDSIKNHPNRGNYVATHPMAGTEFSGPSAAINNLFRDKVAIFCDAHLSSKHALDVAGKIYQCLGMPVINMTSKEHDLHTAYVSHISHISSFALALTVLKKEKETQQIFNLASGGFDSTVRLAKSSPAMWAPIFTQNAKNILSVLDKYISELETFREAIEAKDSQVLMDIMTEANKIKKVLKGEI